MDTFEIDFGHYEEALQQREQIAAQRNSLHRRTDTQPIDITDNLVGLACFFEEPITETYPDAPETTSADHDGTVTPIDKRDMLQKREFFSWIADAAQVSVTLSLERTC